MAGAGLNLGDSGGRRQAPPPGTAPPRTPPPARHAPRRPRLQGLHRLELRPGHGTPPTGDAPPPGTPLLAGHAHGRLRPRASTPPRAPPQKPRPAAWPRLRQVLRRLRARARRRTGFPGEGGGASGRKFPPKLEPGRRGARLALGGSPLPRASPPRHARRAATLDEQPRSAGFQGPARREPQDAARGRLRAPTGGAESGEHGRAGARSADRSRAGPGRGPAPRLCGVAS